MELLRCTRLDLHFHVFSNSTTILKPLKQFPSLNYGVPIQNMQLQVRAEVARREENPSQVELNKSSLYVDGSLGLQKSYITEGIQGRSELIFLGTGTSEGIPRVSCLTHPSKECSVCWAATRFGNKNRRRNTSIVIRVGTSSSRWKTILIDAGKYFYHSALQWFPYYGIRELDAVLLTHSHADAAGGLDDLRDWTNNIQATAQVYATCRDLQVLAKTHYYLVDTSVITAGTAVSNLQFTPISEDPFFVCGLKVTPLPVWHGAGYRSLGFRVGDICYISDVSGIPEETYPLLSNCEILILDALRPDYSTATHFGLPQALKEVRKIRPNRTLFTVQLEVHTIDLCESLKFKSMMHLMDHDKINELLAQLKISEGLDVELSYDGLQISINLG